MLPPWPVAVAVIVLPTATLGSALVNETLPLESVLTFFWPKNVLPSLPLGLEKNWTV